MIVMEYTLAGKINGKPAAEYKKLHYSMSPGGYMFICKIRGKDVAVPFDWSSYAGTYNDDGTITIYAGEKTVWGGGPELDDIFEEEWKSLGISRKDLTAKTLAATSAIIDFYIDYEEIGDEADNDYLNILSLSLSDETGTYEVSKEVLEAAGNILKL